VKATIIVWAFSVAVLSWVNGSVVENHGWEALIEAYANHPWGTAPPVLRFLAFFVLMFGGRSRVAYWTGTFAWSATLLELPFSIRVYQVGPEVVIMLGIVVLFVWLAWAFMFGKPSRVYFRMAPAQPTMSSQTLPHTPL
jgi:hypothetical protein